MSKTDIKKGSKWSKKFPKQLKSGLKMAHIGPRWQKG